MATTRNAISNQKPSTSEQIVSLVQSMENEIKALREENEYLKNALQAGNLGHMQNNMHTFFNAQTQKIDKASKKYNKCSTEKMLKLFEDIDYMDIYKLGRLLREEADPNYEDHGVSLLMRVAEYRINETRQEVAEVLIKSGADINAQSAETGMTVLHQVAIAGRFKWAKLFIDSGADLTIQDYTLKTPLETYLAMLRRENKGNDGGYVEHMIQLLRGDEQKPSMKI